MRARGRAPSGVTVSGSSLPRLVVMQQGGVCEDRGMHHRRVGNDLGGGGLVDDGIETIVIVGGVVNGAHRAIGLNQGVLAWKWGMGKKQIQLFSMI